MPLPTSGGRPLPALLLAGLLAASCIEVAPRPLDLAASAARLTERRLDGPEVRALMSQLGLTPPAAGEPWGLDELAAAAWALRTEVAQARAEIEAAEIAEVAAGQKPRLSLALTPEFVTNAMRGTNPWTIALALAWPFETGGKRRARAAEARAETAVATARLAETLWSLRGEVARAFMGLELARRDAELRAGEIEAQRALVGWVGTLVRLGAASKPDELAASAELGQAEAQAAAAGAEVVAARGRLALALSLPLPSLETIPLERPRFDELPSTAALAPPDVLEQAVRNRLDIHRAVAEYAVKEAALCRAAADQRPTLDLGPGLTYDQGQRKLAFGVGLTLPSPAAERTAIRGALAARERAGLAVERVQAEALAATSAALARFAAVSAALAEAKKAELAGAAAVAAEKRLELGVSDRGEVLAARRLALDRRRAVAAGERLVVEALAALEEAVGRPLWPATRLQGGAEGGSR